MGYLTIKLQGRVDDEVILEVYTLNPFYELISWELRVKLDLGGCHRIPLITRPQWVPSKGRMQVGATEFHWSLGQNEFHQKAVCNPAVLVQVRLRGRIEIEAKHLRNNFDNDIQKKIIMECSHRRYFGFKGCSFIRLMFISKSTLKTTAVHT